MWKRFQEKEETPQLNKVFKVFLKNGNASKKKRKHLNYKYWETTQKYSEIPDRFPVLRDFPK